MGWFDGVTNPITPVGNFANMGGGGGGFSLGGGGGFINDIGGSVVDDTLGTNIFGPNATDRALQYQREGANAANQFLGQTHQSQLDYLDPWNETGTASMQDLAGGNFMNNWQQDPGYQFRLQEGMKAIEGSAAAKGMLNSSGTMKNLMRYGQGLASDEYGKIYDREYNRLSQLAGYGQDANNSRVNVTGAYGANVSNNMTGMANANASAEIAQANRTAGIMGQGAQGVGTGMALAASDERVKENIEPIKQTDIDELKKVLKPYHYNYINNKFGKGNWVGVMAQDLEKTKLGKVCVYETREGIKVVDMNKLYGVLVVSLLDGAA